MWKVTLRVALLVGLWLPSAAEAQVQRGSWLKGCQTNTTTKSLIGGQLACYQPTTVDLDSAAPILDVAGCENVDVFLHDDRTGAGVVCTVTWDIEMCPLADLLTDGTRNAGCTTLPGTAALAGDSVESNLAALRLRVHGLAAGANATSCQILVKCAEDSAR